ncbi:MAG: hypothetical protein LC798_16835 [Chloroflexi bacterium]|nr:hypothetical protein [Chloroflexota bacterium]
MPLGVVRHYVARVVVGGTVGSAYSGSVAAPAIPATRWWLKVVLDPARNIAPRISEFRFAKPRPQAVFDPIGRTDWVVITEGLQGATGSFVIATHNKAEYDQLLAATTSGQVLLLQDVLGRQWYIQLGESDDFELVQAFDPAGTYVIRHFHRARYTFREVARPSV